MKKPYNFLNVAIALVITAMSLGGARAETTMLLEEDFSKCTAGTIDVPDETNIGTTGDDPYERGDIDNYTLVPGWTGYGIYQAAGSIVMRGISIYGFVMAELSSPSFECAGETCAKVRARIAPEAEGSSQNCIIEMKSGYVSSVSKNITLTKDWEEYDFTEIISGTYQMSFLVDTYDDTTVNPVQIDWIKIENTGSEIQAPDAPEAIAPTKITDTSFRANWNGVTGAESYNLYVTYEEEGQTVQFGDPINVKAGPYANTAKNVSGLDPEKIYSYYVTAVRLGLESEPSNVIDVIYLDVPLLSDASDLSSNGFTISWNGTPKADCYNVKLYRLDPDGRVEIGEFSTNEPTYTFSDLTGGTRFAVEATASRTFKDKCYTSDPSIRRGYELATPSSEGKQLLSESFIGFTKGSMDNIFYKDYDREDPDAWGEYVNNFSTYSIPDGYTETPGWKGMGVAEAGGVAAISYKPYPQTYNGGYIETPPMQAKGVVTVKLRVHSIEQYYTATPDSPVRIPVHVVNYSTGFPDELNITDYLYTSDECTFYREFYDDPMSGVSMEIYENGPKLTDNEWHDITIRFINYTSEPISIRIGEGYVANEPFFVDDIQVFCAKTGIDAPVATEAAYFVKDGFTAFWEPSNDAESYLLSVYRRKGGKNEYAFQDREVEGTSAEVRELDPYSDYYYTVKAKAGDLVSAESNPVFAIGISTPLPVAARDITPEGFTANWERTPKATRYEVSFYKSLDGGRPELIITQEVEDGDITSLRFTDINLDETYQYAYDLVAYYDTAAESYVSEKSERIAVDMSSSGVMDMQASPTVVAVAGGVELTVWNPAQLQVIGMTGICVAKMAASEGTTFVPLAPGAYVVCIDNTIFKILIK